MNSSSRRRLGESENFMPERYLQPGLNETDITQLREVFYDFNLSGSGFLNPNELRSAFRKYLNMHVSRKTMYKIMSRFDNDMRGDLSFEDFVKIASNMREDNLARYEIKDIFEGGFCWQNSRLLKQLESYSILSCLFRKLSILENSLLCRNIGLLKGYFCLGESIFRKSRALA